MKVKRIVANVATPDVDKASAFYEDLLGLEVLMDLGWIRTYGSGAKMTIQMSVMSREMPQSAHRDRIWPGERAVGRARRFFVRDPFGKLVNILQHD